MIKKTASILVLAIIAVSAFGQSKVDSVIMQYLSTVKELPPPSLEIVRKNKKKAIRNANFYSEPYDSVQNASAKIITYIFGSSTSHARKYYLLKAEDKAAVTYKIIDDTTLEEAISALLDFIKEYGFENAEQSILVRGLTYVYN